jgi:hypothetical protein
MNYNTLQILRRIDAKARKEEARAIAEELDHDKTIKDFVLKSNDAFWNPRKNILYFGSDAKKTPTWSTPVKDLKKEAMYLKLASQKASAKERAKYAPYLPEFQEAVKEYHALNKKIEEGEITVKQAGAMTQADFQGIRLIELLGSLVNQQQRDFSLQNAAQVITTESILLRIPTVSRFQIAQDLGEFDLAEAMKMSFTSQAVQLKKDVAHLAWSDEFLMARFDQPVLDLHVQNATSEFERVAATKVAQQVQKFAGVTLPDTWLTYETGLDRSKRDPAFDINTARTSVRTGYGVLNRAASNTYTFQAYLSNTKVNGQFQPSQGLEVNSRVITNVPRQPNLIWYIDEEMPNGKVAFWDYSSLVWIQGPIRTSTYRDEHAGGNGIYIRNWNGAFALRLNQGYLISGAV